MWQRFQTLFLGMAVALTFSLFWVDVARIIGPGGAVEPIGFCDRSLYLYLVLACLVAGLASLFTYKWRILQMRLCVITALLNLGLQGVVAYDFFFRRPDSMIFLIPAVFPLVCVILDLLAVRNIFLDEAMVRSSYRLRQGARRRHKERRKLRG
ncbi:MAG: DUF4293 domain-containing protein [Bacteroidales bacterium]|nr:DUF4293 domain-containing protein [Bacteroidales bacterium]